ncbi:MAG: polar amino acid transport system substrate-binding protein [Solirubrobacterales bacterium]|nr:polar amino acid transport system substrate-binding protein [Solirubrobacterales bacterium]
MNTRFLTAVALCGVLAAGVIAAGCGSSNNNTSSTSSGGTLTATPGINVAADSKIAGELPADVKSSGSLTVAADATYPPMEFYAKGDNSTVIGADADIAKALGQIMGLKPSVQNVTFDSIIPGLAAGKYNLGMSSFTDTKEREATVDFVTYAQAGTSFYTKASGGTDVATLADLCGHSVAVEKGTTQQTDAEGQSKKCQAAGSGAVDVQVLPDQNGANLAISSGRAELGMADSPVAAYIVQQSNGQFVLGKAYGVAPYGIAMQKNSGLTQPVLDAITALYADGTMQKIFSYWQLPGAAITTPKIDGATS